MTEPAHAEVYRIVYDPKVTMRRRLARALRRLADRIG